MRKTIALAAIALAALAHGDTMKEYKKYAESRRYCVSRVVEGDKVITTWHRNGKPDWILPAVETNALRVITGAAQNNPIQNALAEKTEEARRNWTAYTNQVTQTVAYSNAYVIAARTAEVAQAKVQGEIADLEAKIVKYEEYQTKYPLLKSVFAAFITDAQNRIAVLRALEGSAK